MTKNKFIKRFPVFWNSSEELLKSFLLCQTPGPFSIRHDEDGMQIIANESDGNRKKPI